MSRPCAICTQERVGKMRTLDDRIVFVCDACENDHPRAGRYSFSAGGQGAEGCSRSNGGVASGIKATAALRSKR